MKIPKIIHQMWSGIDEPLPEHFQALGETWKEKHPTWQYMLWDNARMNHFVQEFYPQHWTAYQNFKYNIQRWDVIRYLVLDRIGGMYVDFDYECIASFDSILQSKSCCFASEPSEHLSIFSRKIYFNNALMASMPEHPFMQAIIEAAFCSDSHHKTYPDKMVEVLATTGPLLLSSVYDGYCFKENVYIIPEELVSPFSKEDLQLYLNKKEKQTEDYLEKKLEKAIAVHYFVGNWLH